MVQNRNKLIELFIGNISNAIIHTTLEKATGEEELIKRYEKESITSRHIAKKYREKINPKYAPLPKRDIPYIKEKIKNKVKAELSLRIEKGYTNINLNLVESVMNDALKKMKVI